MRPLLFLTCLGLLFLPSCGPRQAAQRPVPSDAPVKPAVGGGQAFAVIERAEPGPDDAPPGTYGDQGGEQVLPADPTLPDTLLRARAEDTFYRLAEPRVGQDQFGRPTLFIDYEVTRNGNYHGASLIIHGADGRRQTVMFLGPLQSHGTLTIHGTMSPFERPFPENMEVYLVRGDGRYGVPAPQFKVSNSAVKGTMPRLTRVRNWTKEEIDRLTRPPPNYTSANAHPNVGKDTPFAGDTTGGANNRYVEPGGLLLGVEYCTGEWDKEKCLGGLVPIFSREQPKVLSDRVLAREGYAVGAFKVHAQKYTDGIQVVFYKVGPDGKLNPADSYTSELIGVPAPGEPKLLGGDGSRVIGINCRQGAILNGIALVLEK